MEQTLMDKLTILADSAKYDVACTSSGEMCIRDRFNRGKNGVSMTSYGASLYPSIRDVLNSCLLYTSRCV